MTFQGLYMALLLLILINNSYQKLIALIQFTRHGARTPLEFYDIFEKDFYPFGLGELTSEGFLMVHKKGKMMRRDYSKFEASDPLKYKNFVDELEKNPDLIKIFSSPFQRTVLTSYGYLKGFLRKLNPVYDKNGEILDLMNLMKERYSLPRDGKFLEDVNENSLKILPVQLFDENYEYTFKPKCAILNRNQIKNKKEIIISQKDYKYVLNFKKEYPRLFEVYCEKFFKLTITVENKSINCPENLFRRESFLNKIAGIINSVDFHKIKKVDPELIKLSYISYIKTHHERLNEYQAKVEGTNQIRYIKTILTNLKNCKGSVDKFNSNNNYSRDNYSNDVEKMINSVKNELNCRKYVLFSLHDDNIYAIIRSLFDVNADVYNILKNYDAYSYDEIKDWLDFYWPPYISDFSFQVHHDESDNEEYIRLFYNGRELNHLTLFNRDDINVNYSEHGIKLEGFLKYLESRISRNIKFKNNCD